MLTTMIFANDHDAMVAFYRAGFGLETVDTPHSSDGYTVLAGADIRISIHLVPRDIAAQIPIADPPEPRSKTAMKLLFEVADVSATCDRLAGLGAQLFETNDEDAMDVCDVEGNVLRVMLAHDR
jgi:predicted enzyme related to lactoylglutathione lyase